jgi:hypothetical protein
MKDLGIQSDNREKKGCPQESDQRAVFVHHARRVGRNKRILNIPVPFPRQGAWQMPTASGITSRLHEEYMSNREAYS